jgi:hypothetical protein
MWGNLIVFYVIEERQKMMKRRKKGMKRKRKIHRCKAQPQHEKPFNL